MLWISAISSGWRFPKAAVAFHLLVSLHPNKQKWDQPLQIDMFLVQVQRKKHAMCFFDLEDPSELRRTLLVCLLEASGLAPGPTARFCRSSWHQPAARCHQAKLKQWTWPLKRGGCLRGRAFDHRSRSSNLQPGIITCNVATWRPSRWAECWAVGAWWWWFGALLSLLNERGIGPFHRRVYYATGVELRPRYCREGWTDKPQVCRSFFPHRNTIKDVCSNPVGFGMVWKEDGKRGKKHKGWDPRGHSPAQGKVFQTARQTGQERAVKAIEIRGVKNPARPGHREDVSNCLKIKHLQHLLINLKLFRSMISFFESV